MSRELRRVATKTDPVTALPFNARHFEALPLYRSLGFGPDPDPPEASRGDPGGINMRIALKPAIRH